MRGRILLILPILFIFTFLGTPVDALGGTVPDWPERQKIWLGVIDAQSMAYNRDGFAAYTKKDYESAAAAFRKAIGKDKKNCFAYYNLACTLSLLYGQGRRGSEVFDQIAENLTAAVTLDSHWLERAFEDADFNPVRRKPITTVVSTPSVVDSWINYRFYRDGRAGVDRTYDDLRGGPLTDEEQAAQKVEQPPEPGGRYMVLGTRVLVVDPGLDSLLQMAEGMGYGGDTEADAEGTAGSPGGDYVWMSAELDSRGNVQRIFLY